MHLPTRRSAVAAGLLVLTQASYLVVSAYGQGTFQPWSDLARALAAKNAVNTVPPEGRIKLSIPKDGPTFPLPDGPSSALLLELPDYQSPYVITISSARKGIGRTTEIFVPTGIVFDADFQQVAAFTESQLSGRVESVAMQIVVDEKKSRARYLLLYTLGTFVGQQFKFSGQDALDQALLSVTQGWMFRVQRSLDANIQVDTKPRTGYAQVQDKTPSEAARTMHHQGATVKVLPRGKVKYTIPQNAPTFMAGGGPSSVVLLELTPFQSTYSLVIESFSDRSKGIFVVSGLFLDADFNVRGQFGENQLTGDESLIANLAVTDAIKDVKYVLLYTRGDLVGLSLRRKGSRVNEPLVWIDRSLEGRFEIEARTQR